MSFGSRFEREEQKDRRDDLDRDLSQREIGGGELQEGERDDQPDDARQDQSQQPVHVGGRDRERKPPTRMIQATIAGRLTGSSDRVPGACAPEKKPAAPIEDDGRGDHREERGSDSV